MNRKTTGHKERRNNSAIVVARASAATWVVAFSRKVIPGGVFKTKDAAVQYAAMLARAAGLRSPDVTVLG
jgi:signal transduction protein with GAF and PtsI domain